MIVIAKTETFEIPDSAVQSIVDAYLATLDLGGGGQPAAYQKAERDIANAIALANATQTNITSLTLPAGTWDIEGSVGFQTDASTIAQATIGSVSVNSGTLGAPSSGAYFNVAGNVKNTISPTGRARFVLTQETTIYLVAYSTFSGGGQKAFGVLQAWGA